MKYHLDTIPVWDIFNSEPDHCPMCQLQAQTEQRLIESFLGGSVMESQTRIEVNDKGFCARHFGQLEQIQNRLGLALLLQSHLKQIIDQQERIISSPKSKGLFSNKKEDPAQLSAAKAKLIEQKCTACDRLTQTMQRYAYTVAHMVMNEAGFAPVFERTHGACMPHYVMLLQGAKELGGRAGRQFTELLMNRQIAELKQMQEHIDSFAESFDYRKRDRSIAPPPDTVKRAVRLLKGPAMV